MELNGIVEVLPQALKYLSSLRVAVKYPEHQVATAAALDALLRAVLEASLESYESKNRTDSRR